MYFTYKVFKYKRNVLPPYLEDILEGNLIPVDENPAVEGGDAPAEELHGLGKAEDHAPHVGAVHGHGVGGGEEVHVHVVVPGLALQARHRADICDRFDGQFRGFLEGL